MIRSQCLLASFALSLGATAVHADGVLVDKSEIRFVTKQMGVNFEGRFRKWKANVVFLPNDLAKSKAEFDIDLVTIDLESEDSESEVQRPEWFDTKKFPAARFSSTSIRSVGTDKFEIAGSLTMKGVTKPVVVPVTVKKDAAGNSVAEGTFAVKRLDYGIGLGLWSDTATVANDVTVKVKMVLATKNT